MAPIEPRDLRKLPKIIRQTGLSAPTIYRRAKQGTFPRPVKVGVRASAWLGREIDAWVAARVAARDAA